MNNTKETYVSPAVDIIMFKSADIITISLPDIYFREEDLNGEEEGG